LSTKTKPDCDSPPARLRAGDILPLLGPDSEPFEFARAEWMPRLRQDSLARCCLDAWSDLHARYSGATTHAGDELFFRRTYIALVARAAAASALFGPHDSAVCADKLVSNAWFAERGVLGMSREPDLFGWPVESEVVERVFAAVRRLDLPSARSDVLKVLHHAMMSIQTRRGLGELYTPDWLAAWMVEDALAIAPAGPILDPACGSGTFLFHTILALRAQKPSVALADILARVHGADVNPLAVEMARANYLLALGPLARDSHRPFRIPVEECDSLAREQWDHRYSVVIGNPPWVPLRSLPPHRQDLARHMAGMYGLLDGHGEMVTHLESATLFLARCADAALPDDGVVSFLLPRTVFTGGQHHALRTTGVRFPGSPGIELTLEHAIDCEQVSPLFPTPAAIMVFRKRPGRSGRPESIPALRLSGTLPDRDTTLAEARLRLKRDSGQLALHIVGSRSWLCPATPSDSRDCPSPYKSRFRQGATLVPRTFWFVNASDSGPSGRCAITSAEPGKSGPVAAYRRYRLDANIEESFLFLTLLGDDLLPFAARRLRPVFLPAIVENGSIRLLSAAQLTARDSHRAANWLTEAEAIWRAERGDKAGKMTLLQRLDHVRGLTAQDVRARWRVLYPNFQRTSVACIVDASTLTLNGRPSAFVADTAVYQMCTDDEDEAYYLCAALNSAVIDDSLWPLRRGDQAAHPNVHKKLFEVAPIPRFDPEAALHRHLAHIGRACAARISELLDTDPALRGTIGIARRHARSVLACEMREIDRMTAELIGVPPRTT
jgi:SAM-dependent methyltransferase